MRQLTLALLLATALAGQALAKGPQTATLVYRDGNKWVAPADNKPLLALLKAARGGAVHFTFTLPTAERNLNVARVEVLQTLLAREAKRGVVLEEGGGHAPDNRILVGY
jgi:hypothetical protein